MYIISRVMHPLMMPIYMILIIALLFPQLLSPLPIGMRHYFILLIFICTFLIPAISIIVFKNSGWISSYSIEDQKERITPFLFVSIIYAITTYTVITKLQMSNLIITILAGTTFLLLILTIVTYFYKISIHNAASWGTAGFLLGIFYNGLLDPLLLYLSLFFIIISGIVGSARLWLGAHNPHQVLYGSILGFIFCFGAMLLFG